MWTSENRTRYDRAKLRYPSDLSDAEWEHIASLIPPAKRGGRKRTVDVREVVNGGDSQALLGLIARLRAKALSRCGQPVDVQAIQEAGLDGFWLHRLLVENGFESFVVDPASIAVDRRHRRAKTDSIDGESLLRALMAFARGERRVCSMVQAPSPEEEDRRRLTRERIHPA